MKKQNNAPIIGGRLLQARKIKGLTARCVAETIGVSAQAISLYENSYSQPNPETFEKMISMYDFPFSFYFKPLKNSSVEGPVFYRKLTRATKASREIAFNKSQLFIHDIVEEIAPKLHLPAVDQLFMEIKNSVSIEKHRFDVESMSKWIRKKWNLGYGPIDNLMFELEKRGIIISVMKMPDDIDGFSYWLNGRPYIFVNRNNNFFRLRMSLAHELCHLFFHGAVNLEDEFDKVEEEAKNFASAFLAPNITFMNDIHATTLQSLLSLKPKWKMSVAALLVRCERLHLITEERSLSLNKQISIKKRKKKEPFDDVIPPEQPKLCRQAITLLLDNNIYNKAALKNLFSIGQNRIEDFCSLEPGFLSDPEIIDISLACTRLKAT